MWICDECQQPIEKPEDGFLEWLRGGLEDHNYRIVHKKTSCPILGGDCYFGRGSYTYDLVFFCGTTGLGKLLDMFEFAMDPQELAEIIKRIHVPGYEHRRR